MTLWKIIPALIASGFLLTACGSHTHHSGNKVLIAENSADVSATIVTAQLSDNAFNLRAEESKPEATCVVLKGIPAEGLGIYNEPSDVMDIDLTFKPTALNCYEEGPRSQSCRIDAGGFITWVEYGQRRHIKAQGGLVDVTLWHQQGARCNA